MKLLFIANSRIPTERAMGTAIMKQCEAFARAKVSVELIVPIRKNSHNDDPYEYHGVQRNFKITRLKSLDLTFLEHVGLRFFIQKTTFFIALLWYVWGSDAQIVYAREPELIAPLPTMKTKVVELHHLYGLRLLGKFYIPHISKILTITEALKEDVVAQFQISPDSVCVAPSGVDTAKYMHGPDKNEAKKLLGITSTLPLVAYIGSLEGWKGYETFLEAHQFMHGACQFVVAGGTDVQVNVLRQKYPDILFLGFLPQPLAVCCQRSADVLVAPNSGRESISARHTSPLKIFEYMASGVPVVASRLPSICEVLSEDNAILVEPDNPKDLAEGIKIVLTNPETSAKIAERAKLDVARYDWSVRTRTILDFLQKVT